MATPGSTFPAFLTVEYDPSSGGFPAFESAADAAFAKTSRASRRAATDVEDQWRNVGAAIQAAAGNVDRTKLLLPRFDASGFADRAAEMRGSAEAARAMAAAIDKVAASQTTLSASTASFLFGLKGMAAQEEIAAKEATELAAVMRLVQLEIDKTAGSNTRLSMSTGQTSLAMERAAKSSGMMRAGAYSLGQQLQDVFTQASFGTSATQIFALQAGQTASAISMMGSAAGNSTTLLGRMATFMGGPYGIAVGVAVSAIGLLVSRLGQADEGLDKVRISGDVLGNAQSILGGAIDLTTGKINNQSEAVIALARAQLVLARAQAQGREAEARGAVGAYAERDVRMTGSIMGFGFEDANPRLLKLTAQQSVAGNVDLKTAVERIESLQRAGRIDQQQMAKAIAAVASLSQERENLKTFDASLRLLDGQGTKTDRSRLLKPDKPNNRSSSSRGGGRGGEAIDRIQRDAERAKEEVAQVLSDLVTRFAPMRAAGDAYAKTLDGIDRAQRAGVVSAKEAEQFRQGALDDLDKKIEQIRQKARDDVHSDLSVAGGIKSASEELEERAKRAADQAERILQAMMEGADVIAHQFGPKLARILSIAAQNAEGGAAGKFLTGVATGDKLFAEQLGGLLENSFSRIFGSNAENVGKSFGKALGGAQLGSSIAGGVLGGNSNRTTSAIGGALGEVAGEALKKPLGAVLGKFAGALGPLGAIAGGLLGGALGGLFKKTQSGSAQLSGGGSGDIYSSGTSGSRTKQANSLGLSVQSGLAQIAQQFGVDVGRFNVSIGTYKDNYRVSTTGSSKMGGYKGSASQNEQRYGLYDFGDDQAAAISYAILDAIRDGALEGLRSGTQRLLANSDDINAGLSKALSFEQVFKDLKRYNDPIGAALDDVNAKFRGLIKTFQEAGATTQEMADLETLYGKERADAIKQAGESTVSSLKALLSDLKVGETGLSLTTRLANARAAYDPLEARVRAGDQQAYEQYADAARTLLDIQRQISGSGQDYFDLLAKVTTLTGDAITATEAKYTNAANAPSPFDTAPIVSATQAQTQTLVAALQPQLASIAQSNADMARYMAALVGSGYGGAYDDRYLGLAHNY
ncbi:hypothetical protein [Sphingobium sp. CR28]|uniref:hypothetical protein n=1 Tax=Sphingobium sp. CR28 TaxID=3400272 RepID=UPI003FF003AF